MTVTGMPSSTALPDTGFIDDVGAPGLAVMAMALVIVILLARQVADFPGEIERPALNLLGRQFELPSLFCSFRFYSRP